MSDMGYDTQDICNSFLNRKFNETMAMNLLLQQQTHQGSVPLS
jgi:hypothetical protein